MLLLLASIIFAAPWSACLHSGTDARKRFLELDGNWDNWSEWSECSTSCGSGRRLRIRHCNNPVPINVGQDCLGSPLETKNCISSCPVGESLELLGEEHVRSSDNNWSKFSVSCDVENQLRARSSNGCVGTLVETQNCSLPFYPFDYHLCDKVRLFTSIFRNNSVSQSGDMSCSDSRYHSSRTLIENLCKAPSTTLLFGSKVIEVCSQIPSFVAVGKVDSMSGHRDYGILAECHGHIIKVATQDCGSGPHITDIDEMESSAYYTLHW